MFHSVICQVLNLIVAVVVDTFAEARERDVLNLGRGQSFCELIIGLTHCCFSGLV